MKLDKKQILIIAAVLAVIITNVAIAAWSVTRQLSLTGGVDISGDIQLYDEAGTTILSEFDFAKFTSAGTKTLKFQIKNTGNVPAIVTWDIASSDIAWTLDVNHYKHDVDTQTKYTLVIYKQTPLTGSWAPNQPSVPDADKQLTIAAGEFASLSVDLYYSATPNTLETFSLTMSFTAQDA